ncbi:hypothetical protein GGR51DRAFT_338747 [Nemania sp. FL0031]|nr:hypothetical protein GGR51DRAFT_338747 [Nemania sp. FL0031]
MEKHGDIDHALVVAARKIFGLDGLAPEKAKRVARTDADEAHQSISKWVTERLQAAEFSICEIESTKPSPEFRRSLRDTHEKLKLHRDTVTSLFREIPTVERPLGHYNEIICGLQVLADVLTEFKPSLTPIKSPSDPRWSDRSAAGFRLRALIQVPSKVNRAIDEALGNFEAITTALQLLQASLRLAAALEETRVAEARGAGVYNPEQKSGNHTPPRDPPRDPLYSPNSHKRPVQRRPIAAFPAPDLFH